MRKIYLQELGEIVAVDVDRADRGNRKPWGEFPCVIDSC